MADRRHHGFSIQHDRPLAPDPWPTSRFRPESWTPVARTAAPEGWVRQNRSAARGKVWVGFFHLWTTDADGRRVRKFKEKTLGPASMPKHEAQQKLADYIEEYTGRLTKQGSSIATFGDLWKAFSAVKSGRWSKKTREDLQYLFGKHVLPIVGNQPLREVTLHLLQLLLNKMAEDGYGETGRRKN